MSAVIELEPPDISAFNRQLYERDTHAWTNHTIAMLRTGQFEALDIEHLIEEIEDMSKRDFRSLESYLKNLLMHLLKWQYQPNLRSASWRITLANARESIARVLRDNPSFKPKLASAVEDEYKAAVRAASLETGFDESVFPYACPYALKDILADEWFPQ